MSTYDALPIAMWWPPTKHVCGGKLTDNIGRLNRNAMNFQRAKFQSHLYVVDCWTYLHIWLFAFDLNSRIGHRRYFLLNWHCRWAQFVLIISTCIPWNRKRFRPILQLEKGILIFAQTQHRVTWWGRFWISAGNRPFREPLIYDLEMRFDSARSTKDERTTSTKHVPNIRRAPPRRYDDDAACTVRFDSTANMSVHMELLGPKIAMN